MRRTVLIAALASGLGIRPGRPIPQPQPCRHRAAIRRSRRRCRRRRRRDRRGAAAPSLPPDRRLLRRRLLRLQFSRAGRRRAGHRRARNRCAARRRGACPAAAASGRTGRNRCARCRSCRRCAEIRRASHRCARDDQTRRSTTASRRVAPSAVTTAEATGLPAASWANCDATASATVTVAGKQARAASEKQNAPLEGAFFHWAM